MTRKNPSEVRQAASDELLRRKLALLVKRFAPDVPPKQAAVPLHRPVQQRSATPERVEALLHKMSGEALLLLRLLCDLEAYLSSGFMQEEVRLLLGPARAQRALAEVRQYGLAPPGGGLMLAPGVAERMRPLLPLLDEPVTLPGDAGDHKDWGTLAHQIHRDLALLVLALWTVRPKITQDAKIYKRDQDRLEALLGAGFPLSERLDLLCAYGARAVDGGFSVPEWVTQRLVALAPVELLRALVLRACSSSAQGLLLRSLRSAPAGTWFPRSSLLRILRVQQIRGPFWINDAAALQRGTEAELERFQKVPGVEVRRESQDIYYRLWPGLAAEPKGPKEGAGRVYLQPSFEVLVPPEVPVRLLLSIGRLAHLQRVDQVLTMQVCREAVVQAAEQGLTAEHMLRILGDGAYAGVPQNVAVSVQSWAAQAGQARFVDGLVLSVRPDADALVSGDRELAPLMTRIGAGIYLLRRDQAGQVQRRLKAKGVQVAEGVVREGSPSAGAEQRPDPGGSWGQATPVPLPEGVLHQRCRDARAGG